MAEQTFRSPGFFEREIDLTEKKQSPVGTPAGVVGTAEQGPAFVPVTVGSFLDFETVFGRLHPDRPAPYAVKTFLDKRGPGGRGAVTFMRVLGAGANRTVTDFNNTRAQGTVRNAGFLVTGSGPDVPGSQAHKGAVQFLCARHVVSASAGELQGFPVFSDNDSFLAQGGTNRNDDSLNILRAVIFTATGTRIQIMDGDGTSSVYTTARQNTTGSFADLNRSAAGGQLAGKFFKLVISSTAGTNWSNDDGNAGIRILTASLDPNNVHYVGKVLNTDPLRFQEDQHLLYADFAVEDELAKVLTTFDGANPTHSVAILSGTSENTSAGGLKTTAFRDLFGRFDTRFKTPRTPKIISQPYGLTEYDLFHFEALSDGAWANDKIKVSIANVRASSDISSDFGVFEVQVRRFNDLDFAPEILERFPNCNLDPGSERYVGRVIGDTKVTQEFDADTVDERRLSISGKYPNRSAFVRVVLTNDVEEGLTPKNALPFGFRGVPALKTVASLTDVPETVIRDSLGNAVGATGTRLGYTYSSGSSISSHLHLTGAIQPPLPFRFKVTRGKVDPDANGHAGQVGSNERTDSRLYWGVKTTRLPMSSSVNPDGVSDAVLDPNIGSTTNPLVRAYTKMIGITELDTLVTGSGADLFNNNKFTLARVALVNDIVDHVTGSASDHMKEAAYIRNGKPDPSTYEIRDPAGAGDTRVTLATLVHSSSVLFNRFADFNKFTTIFFGGFDGINILDRDNYFMNDRAASADSRGKAETTFTNNGLSNNPAGTNSDNNMISSYREAARIMTDPMFSNINILTIPGIRDRFVTDYAADRIKDYGMGMYVMDIPSFDENGIRLFDSDTARTDVRETSEEFSSRAIDNSYVATYYPDVHIEDTQNGRLVKVPSSIAAMGALAFNDRVSYPWYAPAGFSRAGLDFVKNVDVRLTSDDRDTLYDAKINPIGTFPGAQFVIFGQKTLQAAQSALDRINVRRLMVEIKRQVSAIARSLTFEQNNSSTRERFVKRVTPVLSVVQSQSGIERFSVVMDDSNNSDEDVQNNRLNGRIVIVPTRVAEFIAIDFIITNSGVSFV